MVKTETYYVKEIKKQKQKTKIRFSWHKHVEYGVIDYRH